MNEPNSVPFAVREAAIVAYMDGATASAVARLFGVHSSTVRYWLDRAGVDMCPRRGRLAKPDVDSQEIVYMRDRGLSWRTIASEVGLSATGVRKRYAEATAAE